MEITSPSQAKEYSASLFTNWGSRLNQMKEWYQILKLVDTHAQKGKESFVSNDPRTFYNLSRHLLWQDVPHRIPIENLAGEDIADSTKIEKFLKRAWEEIERREWRRGRQSWLWNFVSMMLATGWYAVFAMVAETNDEDEARCVAEIWHPAQVAPDWGDDNLAGCSHVYKLSKGAAARKLKQMGWTIPGNLSDNPEVTDVWYTNDSGMPTNCVSIDNDWVKPPEQFDLEDIPVLISPVAGLPDMGQLDNEWVKHTGESVIATNAQVYEKYDRHLTFSAQLLRDTAQTRWFEKSRGGNILKPELMDKMGAIFRGQPEDSIEPLIPPPIPIELRMDRFDMQQMIQRGGLPWALHGNLQQQLTGYLMAQITSAAQQSLKPYHKAVVAAITEIDNLWIDMIEKLKTKPKWADLPPNPTRFRVRAEYSLEIPGDLVQRSTVARMLNPNFRLSQVTTMDKLFPEVENPLAEMASVRAEDSLNDPISLAINKIQAFRQQAGILRKQGYTKEAQLYETAANALEQRVAGGGQQQEQTGGRGASISEWETGFPGGRQGSQQPRPEVRPNRGTESPPGEGLGGM